MGRVVLKMSISVDGFVGTASGGLEWIFPTISDDAQAWILQTLWQSGTHLMGRSTYLDMAKYWPTSTEVFAEPMNKIPKIVFSKTLKKTVWGVSRVASGDLIEEITRLRKQPGRDLIAHGGASFAQSLSSHGLVDEYQLLVHPVALGTGLRLFVRPIELELVTTIAFSSGAFAQVYRPAGRAETERMEAAI